MPFNGEKVYRLANAKRLKAKDFKRAVYPERSGNFSWGEITEGANPTAVKLELMANLLECSIDELFDRDTRYPMTSVTGDNNITAAGSVNISTDPNILLETNRHLNDVINRQDQTIKQLNRRIDQLIELAKSH